MEKYYFLKVLSLIVGSVFFISVKAYSQSGIILKSSFIKKGDACYLYGFADNRSTAIDTAYASMSGQITIAPKTALMPGMYVINTPSMIGKETVQLLLSQNQKENITIKENEKNGGLMFVNSDESGAYNAYIEAAKKYFAAQADYKEKWIAATTENEKKLLLEKANTAEQQFYKFGVKTAEAYPGTLLAAIIGCNNIPPIPQSNFKTYLEDAKSLQYKTATDFIREKFWRQEDFTNTILLNTPYLIDKTVQFIHQFSPQDPLMISTVNELLEKSAVNPMTFQVVSDALFQIYNELGSYYGNDMIAIAILKKTLSQTFIPDWKKMTIKEQIKIIEKNKTGSIANDVTLRDLNNKLYVLSKFKSEYTLLYFYDPECHSCAKATPIVKEWVKNQKKLKVLGVYIEQDKEVWKKYIDRNKSPENWMNLWDPNEIGKLKEKYWIHGIPAMYLLDKNKKVILKNCNFNQLVDYFSKE